MVKTKLDDIKQKKLIRDPTLDFNKRLNMAPVTYDLKGLEKKKSCSIPTSKVLCGKPP